MTRACLIFEAYANHANDVERALNLLSVLLNCEKVHLPPKEAVFSEIARVIGYEVGFRIVTRYFDPTCDDNIQAFFVKPSGELTHITPPQVPASRPGVFGAIVTRLNYPLYGEIHHFPQSAHDFSEQYPNVTEDDGFQRILSVHQATTPAIAR